MNNSNPTTESRPVHWRYATLTHARASLVALSLTLLGGLLSALYTSPTLAMTMERMGMDMRSLRPLHTTFAAAFIFLGGIAAVHRYFQDEADAGRYVPGAGDRWRLRVQVVSWAIAGAGILVTVPMGITSGREYVGFHPIFSLFIMVGWLCFAWNFFRVTWKGFWARPIYVTMWGVGCLFFIYTFAEQHAYLLPDVLGDPMVDRRVQWKACGTLVGAMNLFVYGTMVFVGEKISGETHYARSKVAYALFTVGLLNSFTNFAHHTYHLPQNHLTKWISFVISMAEIILLFRTLSDIVKMVHKNRASTEICCAGTLFSAAKWWTGAMLFTSLIISIPPLNAVVHGTYVVTGHAMGTMIGIDTMAIMGAFAYLLADFLKGCGGSGLVDLRRSISLRRVLIFLNVAVAGMVGWLHVVGVVDGAHRYMARAGTPFADYRPEWLSAWTAPVLLVTGTCTFVLFLAVLHRWLPLVFLRVKRV